MPDAPRVSFGEAARWWLRLGWLSFGGPAGQIALMQRELVDRRRWIGQSRFLHALNYCMLLPGPEAQQLAIYVGWLLHRTAGGVVAGVLFVVPGALTILALSGLYATYGQVGWVAALFYGLKPAVIAVVLEALFSVGRRALRNPAQVALAAAAYVGIALYLVPFPAIVVAAALVGLAAAALRRGWFRPPGPAVASVAEAAAFAVGDSHVAAEHTRPSMARALRVTAVCLTLWWGPMLGLWALVGPEHVLVRAGLFFSQAAVVSFGGAYAVLAYVAQAAVSQYGWLTSPEMLDGLGLAETTPGPLILVVQFVGFLAAHRHPAGLDPALAGSLGALVVLWVTFVPSFFWIFLGAPFVERLRHRAGLASALGAVTSAVVGVILNLSLWFALHVLFGSLETLRPLGARLLVPRWTSLDPWAAGIALGALWALGRRRWGVARVIGVSALVGLAVRGLVG